MSVEASDMVERLETALNCGPAGVVSVRVDGQEVVYNRAQALEELRYWRAVRDKALNRRPLFRGVDLSGL